MIIKCSAHSATEKIPGPRNSRYISNLANISKLIEKVIAPWLRSHMTKHDLYGELQSSYRKFHSSETILTGVHDDIDDNKSLLSSIGVLLLIPRTMMYFLKDLNLDSVSMEQP